MEQGKKTNCTSHIEIWNIRPELQVKSLNYMSKEINFNCTYLKKNAIYMEMISTLLNQ